MILTNIDFIHIIWHAFTHAIKIIPFIFISFLLIEYFTHKHKQKMYKLIETKGPIISATLGLVPQCGFSSTVSTLYSSRVVSIGSLFAVLIATSDEAILVFLSYPSKYHILALLLLSKFIIAIVVGTIIDKFFKNVISTNNEPTNYVNTCSCTNKTILISSIKHTLQIFVFLFLFAMLADLLIEVIGLDNLNSILLNGSIFQPVIASVIGLIPTCASSILLTELYLSANISFFSMLAGLIANAGIGVLVLFKANKNQKENIKILALLFAIALVVGIVGELILTLF